MSGSLRRGLFRLLAPAVAVVGERVLVGVTEFGFSLVIKPFVDRGAADSAVAAGQRDRGFVFVGLDHFVDFFAAFVAELDMTVQILLGWATAIMRILRIGVLLVAL